MIGWGDVYAPVFLIRYGPQLMQVTFRFVEYFHVLAIHIC